ncbi:MULTISPECIES: ABC transporter permease [Paenibacillus]|uniref:ABC transporter permease n=1 Tax=Paenibacillus TaxID=44249 RepID=UPI000FD6A47D|nr:MULTISPECIES: ABC transporter permease subunit [Paenibacillus]NEN84044.1 sugar ABC transporter permease [Paenibacillus elgii]GLI06756.1 sugar ABC transporter permease [Paenibacillus tyrfis]GMX63553.1 sugar ABC transporter permease [Paenibacillus elgii]
MKAYSKLNRIWADKVLYLMLLPCLAYFVIFHVWPIIGMKLAFYEYRILGDNVYVGLKYFRELFSTPIFSNVLANTLIISAMKMFLIFPIPILFALMLNEFANGKFRKAVQVVSYLPHFLSWVVIAGIWFEFLSPSTGAVNDLIKALGFPPQDFLTDKGSIRWVLIASEGWRSIGWDSIIFLAAIMGVSPSLYEAAYVDGASRWHIVTRVVLPHLYVPMVTIFILNVGFIMNAGLDQVLNFTNDSVNSQIDIIDTYVYRVGLINGQYSFATAANLFKSLIGVVLVLSTHFISKKLTSKGAW